MKPRTRLTSALLPLVATLFTSCAPVYSSEVDALLNVQLGTSEGAHYTASKDIKGAQTECAKDALKQIAVASVRSYPGKKMHEVAYQPESDSLVVEACIGEGSVNLAMVKCKLPEADPELTIFMSVQLADLIATTRGYPTEEAEVVHTKTFKNSEGDTFHCNVVVYHGYKSL